MSYQNRSSRFKFEIAEEEYSSHILRVLEEEDFKGGISILYTRRPNAVLSLKKEGEDVVVVICRDRKTDDFIGFGACAINRLYVGGRVDKVGYVFALGMAGEYRKKYPRLLPAAYEYMGDILRGKGVEHVYTTILGDNKDAQNMFEKKRKSMPDYNYAGDYSVHCIRTNLSEKGLPNDLELSQACESDVEPMLAIFKEQGMLHDFYPAISREDLYGETDFPLKYSDFYVLKDKSTGKLLACAAAWDQSEYKQHILMGYKGRYRVLKAVSPLLSSLGIPRMPKPGSALRYFTVSFYAASEDNAQYIRALVTGLSRIKKEFDYFIMGASNGSEVDGVLRGMSPIVYSSRVYTVDWQKPSAGKFETDRKQIYLECARL